MSNSNKRKHRIIIAPTRTGMSKTTLIKDIEKHTTDRILNVNDFQEMPIPPYSPRNVDPNETE